MLNRLLLLSATLFLLGCQAEAPSTPVTLADPQVPAPQTTDERTGGHSLTIEMTEGTNMAAAVSPDGQSIALTLQGALWLLPIQGGEASRLTDWQQFEVTAPVWAPDGGRIAFQHFDGHYYQIWTIAADGSDARAVTSGYFDHREPAWHGNRIAFASDRSGDGSYDIWSMDLDSGDYQRWTRSDSDAHSPAWSPDGSRIAYVDDDSIMAVDDQGNTQVEGTDSVSQGSVGQGAVHAPTWLPDGSDLIYQNHQRQLVTNEQIITRDEDVFPFPASWLPDGGFIYTADGQIRQRGADFSDAGTVAFSASFTLNRPRVQARDQGFDSSDNKPVKGFYSPSVSPDGELIAFVALNDLWVMRIGGSPERLTDDTYVAGSVSWGPDQRIYFTSDRHGNGRPDMYAVDPETGEIERVSVTPEAFMVFPELSPDGQYIAYVDSRNQSMRIHDISAGTSRHLVDQAWGSSIGRPTWSPDGRTIAFADIERANTRFREGRNLIRTVDVETGQWQFHEPAPLPDQLSDRFEAGPVWSPDGRHMAFIMRSVLYVMPVNADGSPAGSAQRLTEHAADMPTWAPDSRTLVYLANGKMRSIELDGSNAREIAVDISWQRQLATGRSHIHAGALWDGVSSALQQNMLIVLEGSRIAEVRPADDNPRATAQAAGARFVDASELTVMPGLWDAHVHPRVLDMTGPYWAVQLAYGITSVLSNGGSTYHTMLIHESIEAGQLAGPRLLTSPLFDGQRPFYGHHRSVHDEQALELELDKARELEMHYLKAYVRAPISYIQRTAEVANEMGVPNGSHFMSPSIQLGMGGTTHLSASQRMSYSWTESAGGQTYQDAMTLFTRGQFDLSSHHTRFNNILGDEPGILDDPRYQLLMPDNYRAQIEREAARPPTEEQRQAIRDNVATPIAIAEGGGLVTIGSDTPLAWPALGLHAQLRAYASVVDNHTALQAVTINAARYSYADQDLGSVEPGKIADLVMVRGNPLDDVRHAAAVEHVMKNGQIFSMQQIRQPYHRTSSPE